MPLTTKVKEDFYFQELIEKKIDVEYWDLTEIFFKDVFNNKLNDKYIFEINSYLLFKDFIKSQDINSTLFIINITFNYRTLTLHKILTNSNCKTAFFARGAMPMPSNRNRASNLFFYLNKLFNFKLLHRYIADQYALLLKKNGVVKHHDIVFRAGTSGIQTVGIGSYIENKNSIIIDINSFDYDTYVNTKISKKIISNKYCVFLDEYLPFHPDFKMFNIKTICPVDYYRKINSFFDNLERKFGYEVIIAAHPKAHKYIENDFFEKRKLIYSKTSELVKDAEFIIAHCSSSISFSVLNKKPILALTMNEIKINMPNYFYLIKRFSEILDAKLFNLDEDTLIDVNLLGTNNEKYLNYTYEYLTSRNSKDFDSSRIFVESILNL